MAYLNGDPKFTGTAAVSHWRIRNSDHLIDRPIRPDARKCSIATEPKDTKYIIGARPIRAILWSAGHSDSTFRIAWQLRARILTAAVYVYYSLLNRDLLHLTSLYSFMVRDRYCQ